MKKYLLFALPLMALSFASCSDDNDNEPTPAPEPEPVYDVITFTDCEFPEGKLNNYASNGGSYTEFDCTFQFADKYGMTSGCVVSEICSINDDKDSNPKPFGVALESAEEDATPNKFLYVQKYDYSVLNKLPEAATSFAFEEGMEREIYSIDVMNSTEMYQYMTLGYYTSYTPMTEGDWCLLTLTGYNADGEETGTAEVYLADFRDGKSDIITKWTTVSTVALGKVNKVEVNVTFPETWNKPNPKNFSVCLDNIKMPELDAEK
ncbi:MAG: DUF4465 domain-containing protein [Paramuribaculum sp.]|nr:DUF4465 domain-containing protein [Paramuribaculum sp.]